MTKPTFMVVLIALAMLLQLGGEQPDLALLAVVLSALAGGLVGDVALLTGHAGDRAFLVGLAAFLVGHLAYAAALLMSRRGGPGMPWVAIPVTLVLPLVHHRFVRPVIRAAGPMRPAVLAYESVILLMLIVAWACGPWLAAAGALSFVVSDLVLARREFLGDRRWSSLAVMSTYHVAQVLLVWGLLA